MKKSIGDNIIPKDWTLERGLELIDSRARAQYRQRAADVRAELEEAESFGHESIDDKEKHGRLQSRPCQLSSHELDQQGEITCCDGDHGGQGRRGRG